MRICLGVVCLCLCIMRICLGVVCLCLCIMRMFRCCVVMFVYNARRF